MQYQTARHRRSFSKAGMDHVFCEGWVLKKRRKKMQGFARRYFKLQQSGWLSYSFEPGQPDRDEIFLPHAAISSTPGRRDIHVDDGHTTFHIKCLTAEDFTKWMSAFRKFLAPKDGPTSPTLGRRSTIRSLRTPQLGGLGKAGPIVEEMGNTINELQTLVSAWQAESLKRRSGSIRSKAGGEKRDRSKEHGGSHVLGFLKKAAPHHQQPSTSRDSNQEEASDAGSASGANVQKIQDVLDNLKHQHAALTRILPAHSTLDLVHSPMAGTSLAPTSEEDGGQTPTTGTSLAQKFARMSVMSSNSGGSNSVWFDAPEPEGAEEFILGASPGEEGENSILDEGVQPNSPISQSDNMSGSDATTDADTDVESDTEAEITPETAPTSPAMSQEERQVVRRTELPSGPVGDEGSLFAVLKKNIGKDLSQVAMPVSFNEPLTLLQKCAEEIEYYDLFSQAAHSDDPVDRMCLIAAFAVSTYANTKQRTGRKGFNPMLTETYEEPRMRFIAEKVSHNPVILAYHAEGDCWELWATSSGKTKFWGKSLEIIPQGTTHLKLGDEHYQWKRPSSFMRNLMMGTKYLEHCGKMTIENTTSGSKCVLDFKEGGYWGPSNIVSGTVVSSFGKVQAQLEGKWDEQMALKLDSSHLRVLWRITPFPKNAPDLYGFTAFGITLNEITPDLEGRLPPTDSRLRTDVRALEEGDIDRAEEEKKRIEEMQRDRRKRGVEPKPRWFKPQGDEWVYVGGYWEQREHGWKDIQPLW